MPEKVRIYRLVLNMMKQIFHMSICIRRVFINGLLLLLCFSSNAPLMAQSEDSSNQLLARQQLRIDMMENSLKELTGMVETEMRDLKIQINQASASAVAAGSGNSGDLKVIQSDLARLSDSLDILNQRITRTIELTSDVEFRVLRLEKRMQTLLSLSDADLSAQLAQQDVTSAGNAPEVSMSRDLATGETVWTIEQSKLNEQLAETTSNVNQSLGNDASSANEIIDTEPAPAISLLGEEDVTETASASENVSEQVVTDKSAKPSVLPDASAEDQYRHALGLALRNDLPTAEAAFSEFRDIHPDHERSADALFWLGRVQFMQSQYENAAMTFTTFNKLYDGDARLVDTTLWIAESVAQFASAEQACEIYQSLPHFLDQAPDSFTNRLSELSAGSGCIN